jgi:carbon-monoxide dehydrogenase small subunit
MLHVSFKLNNKDVTYKINPEDKLIDVLRNNGLTSVKRGCNEGDCGACTILLDEKPVQSCILFAKQVEGKDVKTIDFMSVDGNLSKLQQIFIDNGAVQCGFCTPGMLLSTYALLKVNPKPTEDEIKIALSGNLCRCTGYIKIIEAVKAASKVIKF